ncbi:MAG TPA: hypothetical protein VNI57_07205 [Candidatus Saccharimonadales bacterium]|nr:hypothetical protein [Candidatus Saccharimonadales bacterium]
MSNPVIVSREMYMVFPDGSKKKWTAKVMYARRERDFCAIVPNHVHPDSPRHGVRESRDDADIRVTRTIHAETPEKVFERVQQAIYNYRDSLLKKRKVILVKLGYQKDGEEPVNLDEAIGGSGLVLDWCVRWERRRGEQIEYSTAENDQHGDRHRDDDGWKAVDWSEQREEFLRGFQLAIDELIFRVEHFLGDEKRMLELMDRGGSAQRLLLGPKRDVSRETR